MLFLQSIVKACYVLACVAGFLIAFYNAYEIRLYAIKTFGKVIHEFDPWFNFRATQYLADHGLKEFFQWFDHRSWYPLGRPVGTTIYPGMQMVSVFIWTVLNEYLNYPMSLNDVCVYIPTWFGVSATLFLGLLSYETSGSLASATFSALIFAIIPAHIMRSVGGGFDNESVALTTMCSTFYLWTRALRYNPSAKNGEATTDSYIYGALTGISYICMVANWGGFIFVLNMVAAHAGFLAAMGRYTSKLHRAYSLFYVIGTLGAMQIPVVGWGPLKSLEQLAACAVFLGFQVLEYCEVQRRKRGLTIMQHFSLRVKVFTPIVLIAAVAIAQLTAMGYFGPLSARVRGLFVQHTRTGNPLVDSVAEHQPASAQAYNQYLNVVYDLAPIGFGLSFFRWRDSNSFILCYAVVAFYFANRMSRLIVLIGPVASALAGVVLGMAFDQLIYGPLYAAVSPEEAEAEAEETKATTKPSRKKGKKKETKKKSLFNFFDRLKKRHQALLKFYNTTPMLVLRVCIGLFLISSSIKPAEDFYGYSQLMAERMSHPSIMFKAKLQSGKTIIVDDYREGYWWIRDNTPEDSRILSWWDYGYQISGIANRTTLADGNTWNHEHIATIGRILTAPEKEAHKLARHLADYVLVWAGGGGDDLAKSPHMARIGNSVYPGLCPDDPTCAHFGFYSREPLLPTPAMEASLLYKLSVHGQPKQKSKLDEKLFKHVFTSKYGKLRVFKVMSVSKKSKEWVADPANRICDRPGSWYCVGQYPPGLQWFIKKKIDFKQLEDFNVEKDEASKKYTEQYMAAMDGKGKKRKPAKGDKNPKRLNYIGCYADEKFLPKSKEYAGGATGAQIQVAYKYASEQKKKYVAIARAGGDGYSFVFNEKPGSQGKVEDKGCKVLCADNDKFYCGCADGLCEGLKKAKGQKDLRRWVVYELADS